MLCYCRVRCVASATAARPLRPPLRWDGRQEHPPTAYEDLVLPSGSPEQSAFLLLAALSYLGVLPSSPVFIPSLPTSESCAEPRPWRCGAAPGRRQQQGAASPAGPRAPSPLLCAADALPPSPAARGKAVVCMFAGAEGVGRGESALSALADGEGAGSQVGWRLWTLRAHPLAQPCGFLPDSSEQPGGGKGHTAGHDALGPSATRGSSWLPQDGGRGGGSRATRCLPPFVALSGTAGTAGGSGGQAERSASTQRCVSVPLLFPGHVPSSQALCCSGTQLGRLWPLNRLVAGVQPRRQGTGQVVLCCGWVLVGAAGCPHPVGPPGRQGSAPLRSQPVGGQVLELPMPL